jgi:ATP-dependent helicase/nuclease subunit A
VLTPEAEASTDVGEPWEGEILVVASPQRGAPQPDRASVAPVAVAMPGWAGAAPDWRPAPPPAEPVRPVPVAPSRPADAVFGSVPDAASPLAGLGGDALQRGALIHQLLQHVPSLPVQDRAAAVQAHVQRAGAPAEIAGEVLAVLGHPDLAPLFGPHGRAEQPLTGLVDGVVVSGLVDRVAVLPDAVYIADYKTNRAAPETAEDTPPLYLRQMAAYRAILGRIFPGRPVRCALVWTRTARVMPLPDSLLDSHAPGSLDRGTPRGQVDTRRQAGRMSGEGA